MTIQEQFENAVADFKALILEGLDTDAALAVAEDSNGLKCGVLQARLAREVPIEVLAEKIRREADYDRFAAALKQEVDKCRKRVGAYSTIGIFDADSEKRIAECLQDRVGRALTDHELWMIEEELNPWISELKLARSAGLKPLRKFTLGE